MNRPAPRSIDEYLKQLRAALAGQDPALIQDALYDAEEYLRAEIASHPDKSEADVLELIASTYGAPEEVAAAYVDTEAKVKAALKTPAPRRTTCEPSAMRRFFGIYSDPRAYTSLFYMLLTLLTGMVYFTFVVAGLSLSLGLAVLIIGIPFFLAFIGISRVISLGEGRLLEAISGERMPRRPVHPGAPEGWWARIVEMLKDSKTWTTLFYFLVMLPVGMGYFVIAVVGLCVGLTFIAAPLAVMAHHFGWIHTGVPTSHFSLEPEWLASPLGLLLLALAGIVIVTTLMHLARGIGLTHTRVAKALLVSPGG